MRKGFTLVELLVVISVIGILSSVVFASVSQARNKAYMARTKSEFRSMERAPLMYLEQNDYIYPPDTARDIPAGFTPYIANGTWPRPGWPGSYFDWENWNDPDNPGEKIYQVSVRFCPTGGSISTCVFPNEPWASGFGINSAVYYCIYGACRSHNSEPITYPGYCVNC